MIFFFFFKQKTAYEMRISDWSSDVCSSDLPGRATAAARGIHDRRGGHRRRRAGRRERHPLRPDPAGCRAARHGRSRALPADAQARRQGAGDHADGAGLRCRHDPRCRRRSQRLRHQTVQGGDPAGPHSRPAAPARAEGRRGVHIGPYSFRPAAKLLLDEGRNRKVRLTEKETAILKYLYRAGDRMVRREVLLNEVWGYNAGVTTHTLETHVYRLRQKIEPDPQRAAILVTDAGDRKSVE